MGGESTERTGGRVVAAGDGARLWAVRQGDGAVPVVLCHGGPGLWDTLGDVAELLAGAAASYRWDQRGCGRSEGRDGPFTMARAIADLDAVRAHFGLARPVFLGHSWGASLALRYALAHPERVSGLVYVSGTGIDPQETWRPGFLGNFDAALSAQGPVLRELWARAARGGGRGTAAERQACVLQWSADFVPPAGPRAVAEAERMAAPFLGVNAEANAALVAEEGKELGSAGLRGACAELEVPVLVVDGESDIRPRTAVDSLVAALPRVERVVLAGAGHLPWSEAPAEFGEAVRGFLEGVRG
ncbi:alpha/beta fold hydrolase [Streptomyces sp. NPDC004134]|uniref:alpha/beta fold hydrolase n=1 Tax=Streptomyces sp. NPDC004134 TaxID=3364691 RepID=UPI0036BE1E11